MSEQETVDFRWPLKIIGRRLWLIVFCALVGVGGAFAVTSQIAPVYSASVTLLVQPPSGTGVSDYQTVMTGQMLARTYSQMLEQQSVLEVAIAYLQLPETPATLRKRIKIDSIENTQLIRLTVQHTHPPTAALIANTLGEAFIDRMRELQSARYADSLQSMRQQIDEMFAQIEPIQAKINALGTPQTTDEQAEVARLESMLAGYRNTHAMLLQGYENMRLTAAQATQNVVIAEPAQVPTEPIQQRLLYMALAGVVGAITATGVVFLLESLDDAIRTPDDIRRAVGLKTLGTVGQMSRRERSSLVAAQPRSPHAEAFYVLCANVCYSGKGEQPKFLLVTSPNMSEGKSIVAANLAVAMARAGLRVVAVDADSRRPALGRLFDCDPFEEGLTKALTQGRVDGLLKPTSVDGLMILPSGELPSSQTQLLSPHRVKKLLGELAQQADVVVMDGPPVLPVADTVLLAHQTDGVLLVVHAGRTRQRPARQAVENLRQVGATVLGCVLNAVPTRSSGYYYSSYAYKPDKRKRRRPRRQQGPQDGADQLAGEGKTQEVAPPRSGWPDLPVLVGRLWVALSRGGRSIRSHLPMVWCVLAELPPRLKGALPRRIGASSPASQDRASPEPQWPRQGAVLPGNGDTLREPTAEQEAALLLAQDLPEAPRPPETGPGLDDECTGVSGLTAKDPGAGDDAAHVSDLAASNLEAEVDGADGKPDEVRLLDGEQDRA